MRDIHDAADTAAPQEGLIKYETIPFDSERHRAKLELWVVRGGVCSMLLLIVATFVVLMWGPDDAKTALAPAMAGLVGLVLGVLGCVFNPFKGRHSGRS
jgi:hypothetical protein